MKIDINISTRLRLYFFCVV